MKIINRYVLKEHIGPFVFALSALTSLILLQYIARRFGDLVGKGLSWQVITEFFILSIPFTVAMTLPMSVLVAVLYAFSRLASENEITALKAGGVSSRSLLLPALVTSIFLAVFMLWFNDQVLSKSNHELATLQMAIVRTKPTFALKPQIINPVKEGQLYLRADQINQDESGRMFGVTIFDVSDASKRRSIYADSGRLSFATNKRDLVVHLYHGMMMSAATDKPGQLSRIYYRQNIQKVRDVANQMESINADSSQKGEREMSVCEMQLQYETRHRQLLRAYADSQMAQWRADSTKGKHYAKPGEPVMTKAGGIGALYCRFTARLSGLFKVKTAQAAELPPRLRVHQDTTKKKAAQSDSVFVLEGTILKKVARNKIPPGAYIPETAAAHATNPPASAASPPPAGLSRPVLPPPVSTTPNAAGAPPANVPATTTPAANPPAASPVPGPIVAASAPSLGTAPDAIDAKMRLDDARQWRNTYGVEIQKKFSLAFACIVFVLVGAPIALRFPRGGVGMVMGVGFLVFAIYYIGLIGGEALAKKNLMSPFWAMWADNIIFLLIGLVFISQMGNENTSQRGGGFGERVDAVRAWFQQRRGVRA